MADIWLPPQRVVIQSVGRKFNGDKAQVGQNYYSALWPDIKAPVTLLAWIQTPSTLTTGGIVALKDNGQQDLRNDFRLFIHTGNLASVHAGSGFAGTVVSAASALSENSYYLLCGRFPTSGGYSVSVNNVHTAFSGTTRAPSTLNTVAIGGMPSTSAPTCAGSTTNVITSAAIIGRSLSTAEIDAIYMGAHPLRIGGKDTLGFWPLDGKGGAIERDEHDGKYPLSPVNGPTLDAYRGPQLWL